VLDGAENIVGFGREGAKRNPVSFGVVRSVFLPLCCREP